MDYTKKESWIMENTGEYYSVDDKYYAYYSRDKEYGEHWVLKDMKTGKSVCRSSFEDCRSFLK